MRDETVKFFGRQFVKGIHNTYSEYPTLTKDGREVWFGQNAALIWEDGEATGFQVVARDITERKRIEKELSESEERYRRTVETSVDAVLLCANEFIIYANPAALKLFRASHPGDLIGKRYLDLVHPDDRAISAERMKKQRDENWVASLREHRILALDGQVMHVESTGVPVKCRGETQVFSIFRDITDRKRIEEELRDSEERYRKIIETSSDAVLLRSKDNIVIYANPAALKLFRANDPGDLIGKQYLDLVHPDDRVLSAERVKKTMNENWIASPREHRMLALNGQVVHVESTGVPVKYRGEAHIFGIFRDIAERKRAEAKLRQQTDAMEAAIDGMALLNEEEKYVYLNKAHAKVYDYENAGELIGKTWRILYDSDEIQRFEQEIMPEFGRKGDWHGEAIGTKKGGSKFPQELSLTATANGGLICVVRDITDRKQVEEALRESEKRYRELSIVDDLTQLFNSRHFYFQLKMELDRSNRYEQPLTLLLLDIDNFKAFNDAYGHVEGDQVLWRLGQVVKRCLRETDFAFRYGGEEFTVILPMTTSAAGAVTAERIRTEFKKELFSPAPGQEVHVTVSIGLGQYNPQEEIKAFVHRVDQLMYQGKKNGKDRVCSGS